MTRGESEYRSNYVLIDELLHFGLPLTAGKSSHGENTYFFLHLLGDVFHVQPAGHFAGLIIFKHRHPFHLCFRRVREEDVES